MVSKTFLTADATLQNDGTFSGRFKDPDTNLYANFVNEQYLENKDDFQKTYKDKYAFPFTDIKSDCLKVVILKPVLTLRLILL